MKNTGKNYEILVQTLYQAILHSEELGLGKQKNIEVERNKVLTDKNGIKREFDIYWEYSVGGLTGKRIIECKDYNSKVSIDKIDALSGKLSDFPDIRGVFATKKGYQSGAEEKAKAKNIDLLIVREQNDTDWQDNDGTPFLRELHFRINAILPARITDFFVILPEGNEIPPSTMLNNQLFITNNDTSEKYSLYDLQLKLNEGHLEEEGSFEKEYKFNGFVTTPTDELSIEGFVVKYNIFKPVTSEVVIDFAEKLLGVVEYLDKGIKAKIYDEFIHVLDN